MPARVMQQDREIKELFRQRIRERVAREKTEMKEGIDEALPSWLAWAIKPLAGAMFEGQRHQHDAQGERGESSAGMGFWLWLGRDWIELDDVVLEPKPGEFAQIDHVLVGPAGVCLVETKTWDGAFTATRDNWRRKEGNTWVGCESPIKQNKQHLRLFREWAKANVEAQLPADTVDWLSGAVLLYRAKWLKVTECTMPVYESATALARDLGRRQRRSTALTPEQVDAIAVALSRAGPYRQLELPNHPVSRSHSEPGNRVRRSPSPVTPPAALAPVARPPGGTGSPLSPPANIQTGKSRDGRNYARSPEAGRKPRKCGPATPFRARRPAPYGLTPTRATRGSSTGNDTRREGYDSD